MGRDYFIVYFDIEHNLDSSKANQIDLLYLLGATIFQVARQEGLEPDPDLLRELARSIDTITHESREKSEDKTDIAEIAKNIVCFGAGMLGGNAAEKIANTVLKPFTLSSGVSEETARKREIEPQIQSVINNVNLIIADVSTQSKKPLLVVVDGLDKLQRLDQAQLIFVNSRALRSPVCNIIYTVPMLVYTSLGFGQAEDDCLSYLLPNVKLFEKEDDTAEYRPGYGLLHQVVDRRLAAVGTSADELFEPKVLDLLIQKSGGVMRWLIALVQDSCAFAELAGLDRVSTREATRAVEDRAAQLAYRITTERADELKKVRERKLPSGTDASKELLHGLLIVAYRNGSAWFDAHPLIWDLLEPTP
jgi:hypothetical protein